MNDILILIQASCIREPIRGRSFLPLKDDKSVISYLIDRLKEKFCNICIATSDKSEDDVFENVAIDHEIGIFRGDIDNIPARLVEASAYYGVSDFVRVFANYPFVDLEMIVDLYNYHTQDHLDYSFNEHLHGVLWGMGCDVFNVDFLRRILKRKLNESQMQTIGVYIRQNADKYRVFEYGYMGKRPGYKLNIESEKDYELAIEIANNVKTISCESIVNYLDNHRILAKYNLESPPKEMGIEKLCLNPNKMESILRNSQDDRIYPISVELTLTNACNMNCVYCSDSMLRKRQGLQEHISLEEFKRLFDDLARGGTKGIVLEGGGEPTLYSKFDDVVNYAKDAGLAVGLITNGSKRLKSKTLEKFEWIRVSLDASTPEEYTKIKKVDFYETVIDNIAYYARHCPTVGVGYVVTSENISQIEPLVMRLRELRASYIQLRPVVDCEDIYPKGIDLSYLKFYMTKDFGVHVDGMEENAHGGNHGLPCYASSITSIISGDGSVFLCGRLNIYEWIKPIGNIKSQCFEEIWNGEERSKQMRMISDANFCKNNCPQCRISKFNVFFDRLFGIKSIHFI